MRGSLRPAGAARYNARRMRAHRVCIVTGTAVAALAAACGAPHVPEVGGRPAAPAGEPHAEPAAAKSPWLVFPAVVESSRPTQPVQPLAGVRVGVDARMPDHGHGMLRQPRVTDRGDGSHLVEGMLLHMGGFWLLTVDVYDGERSERVKFELNL